MEEIKDNTVEMECNPPVSEPTVEVPVVDAAGDNVGSTNNKDDSQNLFPDSPVYEPDDDVVTVSSGTDEVNLVSSDTKEEPTAQPKRKLSDDPSDSSAKIQKLELTDDEFAVSTQNLDDEVSEITSAPKRKAEEVELPSTSRVRTPARSSPRRLKRSNSAEISKPKTPKTPKSRPASVDVTSSHKTPRKAKDEPKEIVSLSDSSSRPSVEFVAEIPPLKVPETISEENSELDDSQGFHLQLSPTPEDNGIKIKTPSNSDPVLVRDRKEELNPGKISDTRSEGYKYSDQGAFSQPKVKDYIGKTTDQESTDSVGSLNLESPEPLQTVASKMISKLSNGNSSTPTENSDGKNAEDSDSTPDMAKLNSIKNKRGKNESFRSSNNATPSTISPLPNGHSLPITTPQIPVFDVHISHNEENEFLSLYVVRTDNDLGMDMCREYQRISKRFTIDPYLADVSVSNSPSSVTSGGMINLPNRTSFASTVSSTSTSSNRTSDGAFVVPQPPRKSIANPTTSVKGYEALMKKLQDIFSHIRETSVDEGLSDDKVSVGIQTSASNDSSMSNGNASPEEVNKCDKATPKSSLKKTRVRGRRPIAGKTKRALLPTQPEEPEYMHGMNSPEMVPTNGENGKESPVKSPKDEKPLSSLVATPKSVSKLKKKGRPTSPRPATPVEKAVVKQEYPGYAPDTVVLAKWVDKRYYSGKVLEITEPNKYLIRFDDGQTKVLLDDFIIFGDMKALPLEGQSVYAMVDEEQNYEPGLVLGVEENDSGTITYKCTTDGDTVVLVTASELYLTEDQARSLKEAARTREPSGPSTPRRRHHRELDLDNIIQGPRSARSRDKGNSSARKRVASPKSPKASTSGISGVKSKSTPISRKRLASESSEMSESSNSAPPTRLEEVAGVEPEVQRTPRKIDGVKGVSLSAAGPLQLKGASKQNIGKKNSKLTKFENDEDTVSKMGPIPGADNKLFSGLHFLLTCTETPRRTRTEKATQSAETRHYSSEEDGETTSSVAGTDTEDLEFCDRPFNKERLKEQLEAGGGTVYSHFDDVPKNKYSVCKLIAPRPCLTAKYIQCLAADIRSVSHGWVIMSCIENSLHDIDSFALPAGWSILKQRFINWVPPSGKRNATFFKDKIILLCGDQDTFVKFWERVCTLAGATTRVVNEEDLNMSGALALVTEWDCPHEVQNKANQDNIPLVSTTWVVQCLIEARVIAPTSHEKFSFMFAEPE
ncbi:TP53-binding protein 1 isoform X1 [Spodoptera frugiperda]|uniref:TP53-binding protein 1 isoform X1 n=1 Tax=Spodoptera frugiperda TaxID=7108 RepID=A0A9R0EP18_SPOFR|nr:TP53-binding protein 1 isoform X1 [Spodoptera frugiperda]